MKDTGKSSHREKSGNPGDTETKKPMDRELQTRRWERGRNAVKKSNKTRRKMCI